MLCSLWSRPLDNTFPTGRRFEEKLPDALLHSVLVKLTVMLILSQYGAHYMKVKRAAAGSVHISAISMSHLFLRPGSGLA